MSFGMHASGVRSARFHSFSSACHSSGDRCCDSQMPWRERLQKSPPLPLVPHSCKTAGSFSQNCQPETTICAHRQHRPVHQERSICFLWPSKGLSRTGLTMSLGLPLLVVQIFTTFENIGEFRSSCNNRSRGLIGICSLLASTWKGGAPVFFSSCVSLRALLLIFQLILQCMQSSAVFFL